MIAVVRYGAGNIRSVLSALSRLGARGELTDDPDVIRKADRVIFPGVGEFSSAMADLKAKGLIDVLSSLERPFLGICLGMQLMCQSSEEGNTEGLGIFPLPVLRFPSGKDKIPHMGWNSIEDSGTKLFADVRKEGYFYFVHSYYVPYSQEYTAASCQYAGVRFSASLVKDNYMGTQFHPEKSGRDGESLIRSFLEAF